MTTTKKNRENVLQLVRRMLNSNYKEKQDSESSFLQGCDVALLDEWFLMFPKKKMPSST